ncbi:MAG: hypothetical protein AAFY71_28745 [Bacteroidota bacterium]
MKKRIHILPIVCLLMIIWVLSSCQQKKTLPNYDPICLIDTLTVFRDTGRIIYLPSSVPEAEIVYRFQHDTVLIDTGSSAYPTLKAYHDTLDNDELTLYSSLLVEGELLSTHYSYEMKKPFNSVYIRPTFPVKPPKNRILLSANLVMGRHQAALIPELSYVSHRGVNWRVGIAPWAGSYSLGVGVPVLGWRGRK